MQLQEFHYRLPWRTRGSHPGHHGSTQQGGGVEFRGHASLVSAPDPRRIDLRASLRNPFEEVMVRVFTQSSAVPVYAVADLSASMGFKGRCRKLDVLADFVASLGYSAYRTGDPFSFLGCDDTIRHDFYVPLTRAKGAGPELASRLRGLHVTGSSSRALLEAYELMCHQRAIVFLISDFHVPLNLLERVLDSLSQHFVVPVILIDSAELEAPPRFGIVRVTDRETHQQRTLLMRPSFAARLTRQFVTRLGELRKLCLKHGRPPIVIRDKFSPEAVTRYFFE